MIEIILNKDEPRHEYLLRVAAAYIREHCDFETIKFDEAECDGLCLVEDIEAALLDIARDKNKGDAP